MKNQKTLAHSVYGYGNTNLREILLLLSFLSSLLLVINSAGAKEQSPQKTPAVAEEDMTSTAPKEKSPPAEMDSVFVIHFHPTVQCSCCINVGSFARKGLEKYYAKPCEEGQIIFRECNIDEDSVSAKKHEIFGSALGFEKFFGEEGEFKEIESVWEFCEEEKGFLENFRNEMEQFIKASKGEKTRPATKSRESEPEGHDPN